MACLFCKMNKLEECMFCKSKKIKRQYGPQSSNFLQESLAYLNKLGEGVASYLRGKESPLAYASVNSSYGNTQETGLSYTSGSDIETGLGYGENMSYGLFNGEYEENE